MNNHKRQKQTGARPDRPVVHLRNLTPHDVVLIGESGRVVLRPEPSAARLGVRRWATETVTVDGLELTVDCVGWDGTVDLPAESPGTLLVVSGAVAMATSNRSDLVFPSRLVRDQVGRVVGCRALARVQRPEYRQSICPNESASWGTPWVVAISDDSDWRGAS